MKLLFVALLCCLSAATARAADGPITQIRLQHTRCYGPCPIDELTLNANGSAEWSGHKNSARLGLYNGRIAPGAFAELVKFLEDQNFFELRPEIGNGNIDASDTIVSVTRDKLSSCVVFRAETRAKLPSEFEKAFARASAQIAWQKDEIASKSGARGTLTRDLTPDETKIYATRRNPTRINCR